MKRGKRQDREEEGCGRDRKAKPEARQVVCDESRLGSSDPSQVAPCDTQGWVVVGFIKTIRWDYKKSEDIKQPM